MTCRRFGALLALTLAACGSDPVGVYGAPCSASSPCEGDLGCVETPQFPGGYCTLVCDGSCEGEADCVPAGGTSLCLARCADDAACRDGYQCWMGSCRPSCTVDADCGAGGSCSSGRCVPAACTTPADCGPSQTCRAGQCVETLEDAGLAAPHGSPCTRDDECVGGVCLPAALGGVCSLPCAEATDCFEFEVEAGCSAVPTDTDGDGAPDAAPAICVLSPPASLGTAQLCTSDDGCAARICQQGQCTEVCNDDGDCVAGQICTSMPRAGAGAATYMGCGYPPVGAGGVNTVDLGEVTLEAGFGQAFDLATPPDAVSVTFEARDVGASPVLDLTFISVTDPNGLQIFDLSQIGMLVDTPIRWLPADTSESITMLVPNTTPDRVTFVPGLHRFSVSPLQASAGDSRTAQLRVFARVKRTPTGAPLTAGRIDLNIHLVSGVGLTAASAPSDGFLQGGLTRLRQILAQVGVSVGTVRYVDLAQPSLAVIDSTDGPTSELATLFRSGSSTLGGRAVDVFLVRSISAGGGGFRALGIAGGIPGPVELHGSRHSGVVSSFTGLGSGSTGSAVLGQILAHELGHYLGLFHVTEQLRPCGPGELPADDNCAPFGAGDQLADTTRGDTTNLMHWSIVGSGTNTNLSAGQGFVMRAAALVGP